MFCHSIYQYFALVMYQQLLPFASLLALTTATGVAYPGGKQDFAYFQISDKSFYVYAGFGYSNTSVTTGIF